MTLSISGSLAACAADEAAPDAGSDVLLGEDLLVPIPRELDADTAARKQEVLARFAAPDASSLHRSGGSRDFYLAVRRSALAERWFWAVYLKELQPFGPSPSTLGTRVVRFREQNDKLYVFDADDRRATSDVFNPDLILDAFPIVQSGRFNKLPGSGGYILIDPAAGQNRFGAVADAFATGQDPVQLETELSFVQDFHASPDGGRFEQIITAYADEPIGDPSDTDSNELRLAATLGVNLRRYAESAAYVPVPAPPVTHYFLSEPVNVPNTGQTAQNAVHWAFAPGMEPVKWKIGREILQLQADPELGGADLVGAIKAGIESWNAVYGYPVFTAELAGPNDSFADDRVSFFIVDPDPSKGYAYADWRTNPNTGEVRGASVYFGGGFFTPFPDDPGAGGADDLTTRAKPRVTRLAWLGKVTEPLCVRWAPAWEGRPQRAASAAALALTGKEKLERFIQEVTAHEIGHTLGLRHNFKGSLVPPTSSVMEYNVNAAGIAQPTPGPYDYQAIAYLHGTSTALPTLPFCNDGDTLTDPNCVRFDPPTPDPLREAQIPDYTFFTGSLLDGSLPLGFADLVIEIFGPELYGYIRAGTPAEAADAYQAALAGFRAPLDPAELASNPALGPAADALSAAALRQLVLSPIGSIRRPVTDAAVLAALATDAKNILLNLDGVRSYPTRRLVVDALKRLQTVDAYLALLGARGTLAAALPTLPAVDQALTTDLIARIDAAITPYF